VPGGRYGHGVPDVSCPESPDRQNAVFTLPGLGRVARDASVSVSSKRRENRQLLVWNDRWYFRRFNHVVHNLLFNCGHCYSSESPPGKQGALPLRVLGKPVYGDRQKNQEFRKMAGAAVEGEFRSMP
jgi:hypothetical protein